MLKVFTCCMTELSEKLKQIENNSGFHLANMQLGITLVWFENMHTVEKCWWPKKGDTKQLKRGPRRRFLEGEQLYSIRVGGDHSLGVCCSRSAASAHIVAFWAWTWSLKFLGGVNHNWCGDQNHHRARRESGKMAFCVVRSGKIPLLLAVSITDMPSFENNPTQEGFVGL